METLRMATAKDKEGKEQEELKMLGLRVTSSRIAILKVLRATREPLSIEAILGRLPARSADQATVYRTLESFLQKNIVREVVFAPGRTLYECADEEHHHIVCVKCGRVEDIHLTDCAHFEKEALAQSKFFRTVDRHTLELFGRCLTCTKKAA